jgi:hypothetical protein
MRRISVRKTIIGVRGRPDSGKTAAITAAYGELSRLGEIIYSNPRYDATELTEVLEIEGVIVGFASSGDKPDRLERTLHFLLGYHCVVIVCAARLNRSAEPIHKTIDVVDQFASENEFRVQWIGKSRNWANRESADRAVAEEIVAKVREAIGSAALVET